MTIKNRSLPAESRQIDRPFPREWIFVRRALANGPDEGGGGGKIDGQFLAHLFVFRLAAELF